MFEGRRKFGVFRGVSYRCFWSVSVREGAVREVGRRRVGRAFRFRSRRFKVCFGDVKELGGRSRGRFSGLGVIKIFLGYGV